MKDQHPIGTEVTAAIQDCSDRTRWMKVTQTMWRCIDCSMLRAWDQLVEPEVVS